MFKIAALIALCSFILVIPTLTWRDQNADPNWDDSDEAWFQSDDPSVVEEGANADPVTTNENDVQPDEKENKVIVEIENEDDGDDDDNQDDVQPNGDNEAGPINNNGASFIKQKFHYNSIMQLNGRINDSLSTSYTYLTLAFHFDRADVALPGFYKFLMEASNKEKENAVKLMKYMNKRGGWFKLRKIVAEDRPWKNGLDVLKFMLEHERNMNANFLYTHKVADEANDGHLTDFLESEFLEPRVEFIKKLGNYITNLKSFKVDYNLGEYILDEEL